jgi:MFS transporter, YNFM family, putative membrane transport protein
MNPVIFLLALGGVASGVAMRSVEPMLPRLASDFATDIPTAARVITVFAVFYALAQLVHGALGDRFGKLRMVTVMLALSMIGFAGSAFSADLASLTAWRAVTGVVSSASVILGMAYIGDTVPLDRRATVIAQYMGGNVLGHSLGPFVGGTFTDFMGWRAAFLFLAVMFGAVALVLFIRTRDQWATERGERTPFSLASYVGVMKLPPARLMMAFAFVETFFFFGAFAYLPGLLQERFDLSFTLIGLTLSGWGIGGILFSFMAHWLLRRFSALSLVVAGGLLVFLSYAATALLPVWWPMVPAVVLLGFAFNMLHNALQIRATEMAPRARGTGLALFSFAWILGQGVGVAVMGSGVGLFGYAAMVFAFGAGFALLALWMRAAWRLA